MGHKKDLIKYSNELEEILAKDNYYYTNKSRVVKLLKKIKKRDEEKFIYFIKKIPQEILGDIALELPEKYLKNLLDEVSTGKIVNAISELESDDATDLIQDIEEINEEKAEEIISNLDKKEQEEIKRLKNYAENEAGSIMQTEFFSANIEETLKASVERLKKIKEEDEIDNIYQVFIIGQFDRLLFSVPLEDLITYDFSLKYEEIIKDKEEKYRAIFVRDTDTIDKVSQIFEEYNLLAIAVVDEDNRLIGRITSDDMYEIERESSTDQIYKLAGVDDEAEEEDSLYIAGKNRAIWLLINLFTAVLASLVIGQFESTLQSYVALAVLMPIVASMGGNAGTQTLTVTVRQLATGVIDLENTKETLIREIILSLANGFLFAIIVGLISYIWFGKVALGFVIAASMVINLLFAGFFGAFIPLILKRMKIDPAVASSVLLTTVTDIVGFLSFLWLAKVFLI